MANKPARSVAQDDVFFHVLAETNNVQEARRAAGYTNNIYRWRQDHEDFATRWEEAIEIGTQNLEAEVYRRAVFGNKRTEPIVSMGKVVAFKEVTEYSDALAALLLKARRPDVYREKLTVDINVRHELQQLGVNPDMYMQQMIEAAKQKLLEEMNVIDGDAHAMDETSGVRTPSEET